MNKKSIPFSGQDIIQQDINDVSSVIKSGWLAHGKYSERLESLFCELTNAKYATTVSNCTAGLHLSCLAAGFAKDDEVIVPAQTHTATAHAVEYTGANVVFADVDSITGNILISEIEKRITNKTKGIIPVHMTGYPCEMKKIKSICELQKIILIEDCAHAIGTKINGVHAGKFGFTGNFSFYPTKQITTGEGGIVVSDNEQIIEKIRKLKAFGIDTPPELRSKPGVYDVQDLGYNYRMTDFQAALGAGQMKRYSKNLAARQRNGKQYCELLKDIDGISYVKYSKDHSYFLFQIILDDNFDRDLVLLGLKKNNIGVSIHYATPVPLMSYYRRKYGYNFDQYPNAVKYGNQSISLPVHPKLIFKDIEYICDTIKGIMR